MRSGQIMIVTSGRVVGHLHNGYRCGSLYFPATVGAQGQTVPARTEFNVMINRRGYTDQAGNFVEGRKDVIRCVAWNSKNAKPGGGIADTLARTLNTGKEITLQQLELQTFDKRLFFQGQPVINPGTGNPYTYQAISFVIRGEFDLGDDSTRLVTAEVDAFNQNGGLLGYGSRPEDWKNTGSPNNIAWKQHLKDRKAGMWDGQSDRYGYARVIVKAGSTPVAPSVHMPAVGMPATQAAAQLQPATQPGGAAQAQPATAVTPI